MFLATAQNRHNSRNLRYICLFPTDGHIAQISNLLASTTGPIHTVTNLYEPTRDVLDLKQIKVGTTVISSILGVHFRCQIN
jgi:hypothetical protein